MEIKTLALSRLNISSKMQFFENTISVINANDPSSLNVEEKYLALRNRWQELSAVYRTDAQNPLSEAIFDLDLQRDEYLLSVWHFMMGHKHGPIAAHRQAAEKLLRNFSLYADSPYAFAKQKYEVESANITNMLNGWNTDTELMDAVSMLNLTDIITTLATINSQHKAKILERNAMYAAETTDTSPQKQAETAAAYNDLRKTLNSMAYLTPSPLYEKTIREINALIESAELSLKQKAGRKKDKPTENA